MGVVRYGWVSVGAWIDGGECEWVVVDECERTWVKMGVA